MGTAFSASRQIRRALPFRRIGFNGGSEHAVGGDDSWAIAKHQLVHEVPERAAVAGESTGKGSGAFFEGRFKSVAILDEEALLASVPTLI